MYYSKAKHSTTDIRKLSIYLALAAIIVCMIIGLCTRGCRDQCVNRSNVIDISSFVDAGSKNNVDLVNWAHIACENGWGYVWGTYGCVLTDSVYQQKLAQYPKSVGEYADIIERQWLGGRTTDCVGLIKGYSWYDADDRCFGYCINGMPDVGANGMFENAAEKGEIDTIPEIVGLAVWADGHIGVYIGNGWVIEARSTADGVVKTHLVAGPWTHWLKIPYIEYI